MSTRRNYCERCASVHESIDCPPVAQHTPGQGMFMVSLHATEVVDIVAMLRDQAAKQRADAVGRIHNAWHSRIDAAKRFEEIADRLESEAGAQQEAASKSKAAVMGRHVAGRRAAITKATGSAA